MVIRRMSEAARKRRAQHARYQQGPDGRWESNKRKALVRSIKKKSQSLGSLFAKAAESAAEKKVVDDKDALALAMELAEDLETASDEAAFKALRKRLRQIHLTPCILKRTLIAKKLTAVSKKYPECKGWVRPVLQQWRMKFREVAQAAKKKKEQNDADEPQGTKKVRKAAPKAEPCTPDPVQKKKTKPIAVVDVMDEPDLEVVAVSRLTSTPWKQKKLTCWLPKQAGA